MALDTNLVAYWKLDESSGNAVDSVGGNTGVNTGATFRSGKINNAANFNGSAKLVIADATALKPTGSFSVSLWLKTSTSQPNEKNIFQSYSQVGVVAGFELTQGNATSNKLRFVVGRNTGTVQGTDYQQIQSSADIHTGVWEHYVCVHTNGVDIKIYRNGYLDNTVAWTGGVGYAASNYVRMGCGNLTGTDTNFWTGEVDEPGLYSRALTSDEVLKIYNADRGNQYPFTDDIKTSLAAYYNLNSNANDSFGAVNGTETSIDHVAGKVNNCAEINANSDRITLADVQKLKFKYAHTLAMWVNLGGVNRTNLDQLFFKGNDGVDFASITVRFSNANTIVYGINANRTTDTRVECSATITVDSNWHLMIAEYDGATIKIYWDNSQIATANTTIAIDTTDAWYLGNTNSTRAVSKKMDEVGMWSRALTLDERTFIWNSGAGRDLFGATYSQAVTATAALTSAVAKGMAKTLSSTAAVSASVRKQMAKILVSTTIITSLLIKQVSKTLTATVSVTGVMTATRVFLQNLIATVGVTADFMSLQAKVMSSVVAVTATITKTLSMARTLTGTPSVSGSMTKGITHTLTSSVSVTAVAAKSIMKMLIGNVLASAIVCTTRSKIMSVTIAVSGVLTAKRAVIMNATTAITASTGKQVGKLLQVVLTITGKLMAPFWSVKYPPHGDGEDYEIKY